MKRRILALLCASVLACSMSLTALAAGSQTTAATTPAAPSGSQTTSTATNPTKDTGYSTVADVKVWGDVTVDGEVVADAIAVKALSAAEADAANKAAAEKGGKVMYSVDVTCTKEITKNIVIPFNIPNVKKGDNTILVLHQLKDGTWEVPAYKVDNGLITVTLKSLSPVVFVRTTAPVTAPKTGDSSAVPCAAAMAAFAGLGVVATLRKFFR